jgi:hypothetical protein
MGCPLLWNQTLRENVVNPVPRLLFRETPPSVAASSGSLLRAVPEDLLGQIIHHVGLVPQHFVIGGSQQLGAAIA